MGQNPVLFTNKTDSSGILNRSVSVSKLKGKVPLHEYITIANSGYNVNTSWGDFGGEGTLTKGFARLLVAPDSSADTIKVQIKKNTSNATDQLTFTEGTDSVGAVKFFTIDTDYDDLTASDNLYIHTDGNSTTLGTVEVCLWVEGTQAAASSV